MMPITQPLRIPSVQLTEYKREQEHFARLKVELQAQKRARHPIVRLIAAVRGWFVRGHASSSKADGSNTTCPEECSKIVLLL
jgi:hypothetical protein